MLHHIERLQKKPEHIRRRILYAAMALGMTLIFLIWLSSLEGQLGSKEKDKEEGVSPFSVLSAGAQLFYNDARGAAAEARGLFKGVFGGN